MSEAAAAQIRIVGLRKEFPQGAVKRTVFRLLREWVGEAGREGSAGNRRVVDIDRLEIGAGEIVGLIGDNGAGKTTLLKLIAGLYAPNAGSVRTQGPIAYFAGLGNGMNQDLTVRDNAFLYGAICGMTRAQLEPAFSEMLRWAELEEFAGAPLRNLSAGMRTRLAFAVASRVAPGVLLLDEAFSAGDRRFQGRCDEFIASRRGGAGLMLIATHNLPFVRQQCTRALWLHQGAVREAGAPETVVESYTRYSAHGEPRR